MARHLLTGRHQFAVSPALAHEHQRGFLRVTPRTDGQIGPKWRGRWVHAQGQPGWPDGGVTWHGVGLLFCRILIRALRLTSAEAVTTGTGLTADLHAKSFIVFGI